MKTYQLRGVAGAVMLLAAAMAGAQKLPDPLVNAARKAIVSNPEVQARWHNFTAATAEGNAAKSGYRPQVDLNMGVGREWTRNPGVADDEYTRSSAQLSLNQMLFDGHYTRNEVKRLGFAKLTRYYELLEASENIALESVRAYADVARYTELLEEAKQNYVEHKITAQQIEERSAAGVSRRVDLEQANGRLALAESNLLTEIANLHDVSARYQRIMGELPPKPAAALAEGLKLVGVPANALDVMKLGLPGSPTINAAYENVRSAKSQIETRKSGYWPRVDFRVRQSWGRNVEGVRGGSSDTVAEVVMNYNLYRGGEDQAREKQAVQEQYQARDLQEKACRDVRQTLAIAYNDVLRLNEQLTYLDQHRLATEKAREAYRQQFDIGQRTLLDVLDTQNEFFEASRAYINARYNEIAAQARTLAGMGKLTTALGVARPDQPSLNDVGQDRGELPPEELCPFAGPDVSEVDKAKAVADAPRRVTPLPAATATPAPRATPVVTKINLSADALFDFDKSVLKPEGRKSLRELVEGLKGTDLELILAVGHTDGKGSVAYNNRLSLARANAVKAYLLLLGISDDKVKTDGKGKSQPVADNSTEEGRAKNRRVEITVTAGKTAAPARK
jgi:outer membrane protein, adhesin transport system